MVQILRAGQSQKYAAYQQERHGQQGDDGSAKDLHGLILHDGGG